MAHGYPDFEGNKWGILPYAEWSAIEATDKDFLASADNKASMTATSTTYTVPANTTLYITSYAFKISAENAADRDLNQIGFGYIYNVTTATILAMVGGNGGGGEVLNKPIVVTALQQVQITVVPAGNHNCKVVITAHGYEK